MHSKGITANEASTPTHQPPSVQADLYPDILLHTLASMMLILDRLFTFLHENNSGAGATSRGIRLTAGLAKQLFNGGQLVEHFSSITLFLLRCVRSTTAPLLPPSSLIMQRTASGALGITITNNMFGAIMALDRPEHAMAKIDTRFFQALSCLVCECLPVDDDAAWQLALLQEDGALLELTNDAPLSLLCCPAMQLLSRQALATAIKRKHKDIEGVLDMFKAFHMQLDSDELLSDHIRPSSRWPMQSSHRHIPPHLMGGVPTLETSDAYFVPRVKDTSLQDFLALMPQKRPVTRGQTPLCATKSSVITTRMLATLLSLQRSEATSDSDFLLANRAVPQLSDAEMQDTLMLVATHVCVLATQLLRGRQTRHADCAKFTLMHLGGFYEEGEEAEGEESERSAFRRECVPCSSLAEGIFAVLLQLTRLHVSPDARRIETKLTWLGRNP